MKRIKYYDIINKRLVYTGQNSTPEYWDSFWQSERFENQIQRGYCNWIIDITKRHLPKGAKILEGGCGRGDKVFLLQSYGYEVYGVDFAEKTIKKIKYYMPHLKVVCGDVRKLNFPDEFFDGYWSLGVIEHFYDGYDLILQEMRRVLKKQGYLFISIPVLCWLRKQKVRWQKYPFYQEESFSKENFYQFALDPKELIEKFRIHGFKLIELQKRDGIIGLAEEINNCNQIFEWIDDGKSLLASLLRIIVNGISSTFAAHIHLYILKKTD